MLALSMEEQRTFVDWTEDEVLQWLSKLDLGNDYSDRFRGKKITGASLLQLNPEALDALNITDGADRLKIIQSVTTMRADLLVTASASRNTLTRYHSEGTPPTRARNFSEGMIKRFPNAQRMVRRQTRVDVHDTPSPSQFRKVPNLVSLDEVDTDDRRKIESMLTLRAHNKKYLSRSVDGLLKDGGTQVVWKENGSARLMEVLKQENYSLKKELETYYQKVRKLLKLEQEVEHVRDAYRLLESTSLRKEKLETAMRTRLEEELKKLKESMQGGTSTSEASSPKKKSGTKKEIARRDTMIMKLIKQNNDQVLYREQLEKDLVSAKAALQEKVIENDASSSNSGQLDTELTKCSTRYAESMEKLKSILEAMQKSSQKRESLEKQLRKKLEVEVKRLKAEATGQRVVAEDHPDIRISALESDVARWEHKCLELVADKQMALEAAIIPRDSRIAQLERELAQKNDLTEELKKQKANYIAQIQQANKSLSEMEAKCNFMQAALAEKESVIQMLQKSFLDPDNSPTDDSLLASLDSPGMDKKLTYGSRSRSSSQHSLTSNSSRSSGDMLDHSPIGKRKVSHEIINQNGSVPECKGANGRMEVGSSPTSQLKQQHTPPLQSHPSLAQNSSPLVTNKHTQHSSTDIPKHTQHSSTDIPKQRVSLPAVIYSEVGSGCGHSTGRSSPSTSGHKVKSRTPMGGHHGGPAAAWENVEHEGVANGPGTTHTHHTSLLGSQNSVEFIESLFNNSHPGGSPVSQPVFDNVYSHSVSACPILM